MEPSKTNRGRRKNYGNRMYRQIPETLKNMRANRVLQQERYLLSRIQKNVNRIGEVIRRRLKNGNMTDSEVFFVRQGDLTQEYWMYFKENHRRMTEKEPL